MRVNCLVPLFSLASFVFSGGNAGAADVCNPTDVLGPYAFQLTGSTDIAGTPKPTASLGLLTFDGRGNLSGTASATFRGLLLGNPVTGSYSAKPDCSLTWKLQDDSGAYQNFSGTLSADGTRVQFSQTDPGGAQHGIMKKTPGTCSAADLQKVYSFKAAGSVRPMQAGDQSHPVSAEGTVDTAQNGTFEMAADCSVQFKLVLPEGDGGDGDSSPKSMRGFLVEGGKEILAFQTDPGAMVAAHLTSPDK
jgi:hypothetical protein